MSANVELLSRQMKSRCSVNAIAVEQRHRLHAVVGTHSNEGFRQGSAFEKAEGRSGMEFYVHLYRRISPRRHRVTEKPKINHKGFGPCFPSCSFVSSVVSFLVFSVIP